MNFKFNDFTYQLSLNLGRAPNELADQAVETYQARNANVYCL